MPPPCAAPGLAWGHVPFLGGTEFCPSQQSSFFPCSPSLLEAVGQSWVQPSTGHLSPITLPGPPEHALISSSCPDTGPASSAPAWTCPAWTARRHRQEEESQENACVLYSWICLNIDMYRRDKYRLYPSSTGRHPPHGHGYAHSL